MTSTTDSFELATADKVLRLRFLWIGDRFAHRIEMTADGVAGHATPVTSVEGSPDDDWPSSPAIQQLSVETIGKATLLMGVGGSGTSHFSVAVSSIKSDAGRCGFHFDWAARLSKAGQLRLQQSSDEEPSLLGTAYHGAGVIVQPQPTASLAPRSLADAFRVIPAVGPGERTARWSYVIMAANAKTIALDDI